MKKIPYFDSHCDTAFLMAERGYELYENEGHIDLKRLSQYGPSAQFFAIFGVPRFTKEEKSYGQIFDETYSHLIDQFEKNSEHLFFCRSGKDAEKAAVEGKVAGFVTVEGADLLGCSVEGLERGYELGVRAVGLTWNFKNALAGTNVEDGGLTDEGKRFVKKMYDLGMMVDVSHISDKAFYDICDIATGPIVATHSNSRSIWAHSRNLTDDMYRQIIKSGGSAGINLYADFIGGEGVNVDAVMDHICHYLDLGGEKCVHLGGDLDGCDVLPAGIHGVEDVYKIYDAMLVRGFGKQLADDIFYNNLMEVVKRVCDM